MNWLPVLVVPQAAPGWWRISWVPDQTTSFPWFEHTSRRTVQTLLCAPDVWEALVDQAQRMWLELDRWADDGGPTGDQG